MKSSWISGKRIIVTGGAGFIGLNLLSRLLAEGARVILPVRSAWTRDLPENAEVWQMDLLDFEAVLELMREVKPHALIHGAAGVYHPASCSDRVQSVAVSTLGTTYLLEAAHETRVDRLLYLGSSMVYSPLPDLKREEQAFDPISFRGAAKAVGSTIWRHFAKSTGLCASELRLFSVYGPHEAEFRFIPKLLRAAWEGTPLPLLRGARHDFVYAGDVADACVHALNHPLPPGEVVNIGTGRQWANEEVVAMVELLTGRPVRIREGEYPRREWDLASWCADTSKARNLMGWSAKTELQDGLRLTLNWLRAEGRVECAS